MLDKLSYYTSDEEMYLLKTINEIKSHDKALTYKEDKTLLDFFDKSLSNITKLNSAFVLDYLTAQIMCNKLSHDSMRSKYIDMLATLRNKTGDNHKVNNYLSTMQQIIVKCKVEIENMVDVNEGDKARNKDTDNASVYSAQTHGRGYGSRGRYNSYRGNQGSHYNQHIGGYQSYKNNGKPINLDDRGNYLWEFDGNPIDASKEHDAAFALHSSSMESNRGDRGKGTPRGRRGSDQGYGSGQGTGKRSDQAYGSGQGHGRGFGRGYGPDLGADQGAKRGY